MCGHLELLQRKEDQGLKVLVALVVPIRQYVCVFGTHVPWYGVCAGLALLTIGLWLIHQFEVLKLDGDCQNEILCRFPFAILTGVAFAFALDAVFTGNWRTWLDTSERRIGFTFTGWLLGVLIFIFVFGKLPILGRSFLMNLLLPVFALAQSIGRIGCFLGGCCYGKVCTLGVKYPRGSLPYEQVGDVCVFPIQPIESLLLLGLFLLCCKSPFRRRASIYLCGVACIRFSLEFFRGDVRGSLFGVVCISPQQIMSIVFFAIGLVCFIKQDKNALKDSGDVNSAMSIIEK